jgi:hypothetical protein
VQSEAAQRVGVHPDPVLTVPVAVRAEAAGEIDAHLVGVERHPVDAARAQSSQQRGVRARAVRPVFVVQDGDPGVQRPMIPGQWYIANQIAM